MINSIKWYRKTIHLLMWMNLDHMFHIRINHGIYILEYQKVDSLSKLSLSCSKKVNAMPRYKDESPAVRVYTVCDESRYLVVRNVPALGCGDELLKVFSTYGEVEECKPMDDEDCEPYTDVYWIKFRQVNNARFAKRKLDEYVFLGNKLQVSYAPQYESSSDTKEKLDLRRKEVLGRVNPGRSKGATTNNRKAVHEPPSACTSHFSCSSRTSGDTAHDEVETLATNVSSDEVMQEYFPSQSMNQTVQLVREKLNKIRSSAVVLEDGSSKRTRTDNRRRI